MSFGKIVYYLAGGVLVLVGASTGAFNFSKAPAGVASDLPEMQVMKTSGLFPRVTVTSRDERTLVVKRIVINRKSNIKGCVVDGILDAGAALKDEEPEFKLSSRPLTMGESIAAYASSACGEPMVVDVYTNLGDSSFEFN